MRSSLFTRFALLISLAALAPARIALAEDPPTPSATPEKPIPQPDARLPLPPGLDPNAMVELNFPSRTLSDVLIYMSSLTKETYLLEDEAALKSEITIIAHGKVRAADAYQAFLAALESKGFTLMRVRGLTRVVKVAEASQKPIPIRRAEDGTPAEQWEVVTWIMPLENISVNEIQQVVQSLSGTNAKIQTWLPSNTLIITDHAVNLRRVQQIVRELDVAAPKSELHIVPLRYAKASDIQQIIEQIYGTASSSGSAQNAPPQNETPAQRRRRLRQEQEAAPAAGADVTSGGKEASFISKVMSDERTNSLIVLANAEGMVKIRELIAELDVDVDLTSRSQIHVVYLEHAKAEDVASVLSNLSQGQGGASSSSTRGATTGAARANSVRQPANGNAEGATGEQRGVVAAFDSGMRITHDTNTNSLVIIASQEDFKVVKSVIDRLDVQRRQVFVDAVILELASNDSINFGAAYHMPREIDAGERGTAVGIASSQFGTSSLGLSQDLLSGLALGVFGEAISVPGSALTGGTDLSIPAFGIVLNALKSNSNVNIVSNPQLTTLDNEEAKIVVGRKVPFPTQSMVNNITGQPIISFQREDVAITLKITPRVNSSDFVTLETVVEVSEVENSGASAATAAASGGFITSKREIETTVLVGDNQTVVLGGLMNNTESLGESKVPILGDLPVIGRLFRSTDKQTRQTNLMVFLTPHIIDDHTDMLDVMRIKEAQRQEFLRRFYGKSQDDQMAELERLLRYSMNFVDEPSAWPERESSDSWNPEPVDMGAPIEDELERSRSEREGEN